MQCIIFGANRAEFIKIKRADKEKHFVKVRGSQLYRVYPDQLIRMRIEKFGKELESDEVIAYAENEIIPYHPRGRDYNSENFLMDIDLHKDMVPRGSALSYSNVGKAFDFIRQNGMILIIGIVVLYALLSQA